MTEVSMTQNIAKYEFGGRQATLEPIEKKKSKNADRPRAATSLGFGPSEPLLDVGASPKSVVTSVGRKLPPLDKSSVRNETNCDFQHVLSQKSVKPEDGPQNTSGQTTLLVEEDDEETREFEALGLRTGEQALEFFGFHGVNSEIKVLFLNRPPPSLNFRPYDLLVVSRKKTGPEYFTMSASGCVFPTHLFFKVLI